MPMEPKLEGFVFAVAVFVATIILFGVALWMDLTK